ncbi:MAG: AAA family ATPase [Candidatus Binatus sp.]|uniref:AAA family ATPase n=1 Tax=Candidatus Binatus sp. TaxID=2811406 RepID=UPI002716B5F0|nr:AAA family ATPase [Candidatus Binatus sp.]MDO8432399.1 AAA family ATPase [Candidatus Binatus sp.]
MAGFERKDELRRVMKIVLVGDPGEQRSKLKAVLGTIVDPPLQIVEGDPAAAQELIHKGAPPPDVVVVVIDGNEDSSLKFIQAQAAISPHPMLFAALSAHSAGVMKRALRSGADEILLLPLDPGEATRTLLKITEARWRKERREGAVVCSLVSLIGGVGVTSLAANLALALQAMHQRAALVDLDLQSGGLAVFLNLDPELTIIPLARLDRKLDSIQLESALTKHSSGCHLLAAPKRIEEGELVSDITVNTVLDLMRELFDYVIVDCGDHVDENSVSAWEHSDHLFYVLNQSIAATRCAWRFMDLFERLRLTSLEPRFVINRYKQAHPLGQKEIETALTKSIYATIPSDDQTFGRIEMTARDLFQVAPGSPVAKATMALASRLIPHAEAAEAVAGGFVARLVTALTPSFAR